MNSQRTNGRRIGAVALLAVLGLALAACMLSPGKFVSELSIRKDGHFRFSYSGEINVLALSKLADMMHSSNGGDENFTPEPCTKVPANENAAGSPELHKCSDSELAEQKRIWQSGHDMAAERKRREADSMKAMFGGIDPADPRAADELAARLRRQAGWTRVVHRGDGLFDVEFVSEGQLTHDFTFPTIERFPAANPFVQVMLRADNSVRIDAPGFAPASSGDPYRGWMQAAALSFSGSKDRMPRLPEMDGTFVIKSDATILANNTELGPQSDPAGQRLEWRVNSRSVAPPTALVRLGR
jgi:hypothetical protein